MSFLNSLLILTILAISSGCATIIHGTTQDIGITTDPSGADLLVDGNERYKSPTKITMKRKDDHMVEVSMDGYQKETVNLKSVVSGAVAGNIIAGGLIGWGIDAASGGQYRLVPENVDVRLRTLASQTAPLAERTKESLEEKLDQLKKLKDNGKITEEEYKKMRQEYLAGHSKAKLTATPSTKPTKIEAPIEPRKVVLPTPEEKPKIAEKTDTE
jgi:hypothetical protein